MITSRLLRSRCACKHIRPSPLPAGPSLNRTYSAAALHVSHDRPKPSRDDRSEAVSRGRNGFASSLPSELGGPAIDLSSHAVASPQISDGSSVPVSTGVSAAEDSGIAQSEWSLAGQIESLARANYPVVEKLRRFQGQISPQLGQYHGELPRHIYEAASRCLMKFVSQMAQMRDSSGSGALVSLLAQVGRPSVGVRADIILNCCDVVIHGPGPDASSSQDEMATVKEILQIWKGMTHLGRHSLSISHDEFMIPSYQEIARSKRDRKPRRGQKPSSIIERNLPDSLSHDIPALATTVAVLLDPELSSTELQQEAAPLIGAFANALRQARFSKNQPLEAVLSPREKSKFSLERFSDLEAYLVRRWPSTTTALASKESPWYQSSSAHVPTREVGGDAVRFFERLHASLRKAIKTRNSHALTAAWTEFTKAMNSKTDEGQAILREAEKRAEFFDYLVFICCADRRQFRLQETLTRMAQVGLKPTLKTYTSMMHGWKLSKDTTRINALWRQLVESGAQLDPYIWTARISGLMETGQHQAGIQALAEMMETWKANSKNPKSTAVQPTVEVINAALKGLVSHDTDAALQVLAWAGREGMDPDIRTYNIILRESCNSGNVQQVHTILHEVSRRGMELDAATFTVIIEALLGGMHNATEAEQVSAVKQTLRDVEAAGLKPNLEMYGKMLHAVDNLHNGADEAVQTVLAEVKARGLTPSPHMMSMLVHRHAKRALNSAQAASLGQSSAGVPPATAGSINKLLLLHGYTSIKQGDQAMWEAVIEGYATLRQPDDALRIYDELERERRPLVSLSCLLSLLRSLLGAQQHEQARRVVLDAYRRHADQTSKKLGDDDEPYGAGDRAPRFWRHHFWHLARTEGLLRRDDVPEQLWRTLQG